MKKGEERLIVAPSSPRTRVLAFLSAFHDAPNDADIDLRIGRSEHGEAAVLITIQGTDHVLTCGEALKIASVFEETMNKFPNEPDAKTLPNIIMVLRLGAEKAAHRHPPQPGMKG